MKEKIQQFCHWTFFQMIGRLTKLRVNSTQFCTTWTGTKQLSAWRRANSTMSIFAFWETSHDIFRLILKFSTVWIAGWTIRNFSAPNYTIRHWKNMWLTSIYIHTESANPSDKPSFVGKIFTTHLSNCKTTWDCLK